MSTTNTSLDSDSSFPSIATNRIKLGVLITLQILSLPCFLYLFYQFSRQRQLRQSHHHHVVILLLIVSFLFVIIALPLTEMYLYWAAVYPANDTFCSFWNWIHYSLNIVNLWLMAFASIERNWLIFHPSLLRPTLGKIAFHYCPLLVCLIYPPMFYVGVIFLWKCKARYDFGQLLCFWPCYFSNPRLANIDLFLNNYAPLLAIPFFCAIIYIRVFLQKRAMRQQAFKWTRDKKMIVQLWAMSSLYLAMWMPIQLTGMINLFWDPNFLLQAQTDYIYLLPYLIHLLYPFIVLLTYNHEMFQRKQNTVHIAPPKHGGERNG